MKTKSERLCEWIAALRSGERQQARGFLKTGPAVADSPAGSFCCLGVACDLYDSTAWQQACEGDVGLSYKYGCVSAPPTEVQEAYGWTDVEELTLIRLNDSARKSFVEIAEYIETNVLPRVEAEEAAQLKVEHAES